MLDNKQLLDKFKSRLTEEEADELEDSVLLSFLDNAKDIINLERYPFSTELKESVEPRYQNLQIDIALVLFSKVGIEGQIRHSEDGVVCEFTSADVPRELLNRIMPMCG